MKTVKMWRWKLKAQTHGGKVYTTKHLMTEELALEQDPGAVRIESSLKLIEVAETPDEIAARAHSNARLI